MCSIYQHDALTVWSQDYQSKKISLASPINCLFRLNADGGIFHDQFGAVTDRQFQPIAMFDSVGLHHSSKKKKWGRNKLSIVFTCVAVDFLSFFLQANINCLRSFPNRGQRKNVSSSLIRVEGTTCCIRLSLGRPRQSPIRFSQMLRSAFFFRTLLRKRNQKCVRL